MGAPVMNAVIDLDEMLAWTTAGLVVYISKYAKHKDAVLAANAERAATVLNQRAPIPPKVH